MGEILRAVVDKSALIARPRWYVGEIPFGTLDLDNPSYSGDIHIQANTEFLWTSFQGIIGGPLPLALYVQFSQREGGVFYSDRPVWPANISMSQSSQLEFDEYPLLPGDYRLGWTVTWDPNAGDYDNNVFYLVFGGIEYVMPKAQSAYGIPVLGG